VGGLLLVLAGRWRGWGWISNFWFRSLHLLAIAMVVVQAWIGVVCPLTSLESALRQRAGEAAYPGSFIAYWIHELLFVDAAPWVFTLVYSAFGILVVTALWMAPPRWPRRLR
jgi:hypothetical protein